MKNRFSKTTSPLAAVKGYILPLLFLIGVSAFFLYGVSTVTSATDAERLESARRAVTRAAVQCYAIEGQYPPSVAYLEEHYGLSVDRTRYIVDYRPIGGNLMPGIEVLDRHFGGNRTAEPEVISDAF